MKIRYYKCRLKDGSIYSNFGDELNIWLWPRLLPEVFDDDPDVAFFGIGTLLGNPKRGENCQKQIIFGTGAAFPVSGQLDPIDERWKVYFVRGPLTARSYHLDYRMAITDPAILVSRFMRKQEKPTYAFGFMPHISQSIAWGDMLAKVCRDTNVLYIDPRDGISDILMRIASVGILASEAMHGAIVADSLRIPWLPVHTTYKLNVFKWLDWCSSMGLRFAPRRIFNVGYIFSRFGFHTPYMVKAFSSAILKMFFRQLKRSNITYISSNEMLLQKLSQIKYQIRSFEADVSSGYYD